MHQQLQMNRLELQSVQIYKLWKQTLGAVQQMTNRSPGPGPSFEANSCSSAVLLCVQSEQLYYFLINSSYRLPLLTALEAEGERRQVEGINLRAFRTQVITSFQ
ncbi:hypothetical protein EPR50_G00186590 [Perca flavescens]|uniref:Uncharacterized protein n=1 Tax=Perca flavescens TaxID=8167 RepID=A0A484C8G7_PERFV|nr:hypothetical protein EPR50_G00186590 [Perca flavescens]